MEDTPLTRIAVHEAAHVIAVSMLSPIERVCIGATGGSTTTARRFDASEERYLVSSFAGPEAEQLIFGNAPAESDLRMLARISFQIDPTIPVKRVEALRSIARGLVHELRQPILALAEALLERRAMSGAEIETLLLADETAE